MFAAGGLARATQNKVNAGEDASGVGGAATFFVFLFTAIFGARGLQSPGFTQLKYSRWKCEHEVMPGVLSDGLSEMDGL